MVLWLFVLVFALSACRSDAPGPSVEFINISVPYELDSLDPHLRDTISNYVIGCHFYEPLVRITPAMAIEPVLAESWENPDSLTWIFHLRTSARFHNGQPLTADDVVYTFKRLLATPDLAMRGYLQSVVYVAANDTHTVRVATSRPVSILLNRLNFILIVPAESAGKNLDHYVNGTGPYRLVSRDRDQSITMARNESYWGVKPAMTKVTFFLGRSPDQAMEDLLVGRSQFAQCNTKKLERLGGGLSQYTILHRDNLFMKYLSFDVARDQVPGSSISPNPFKNLNVRRALSLAINRKEIVDRLSNPATPSSQPVPPFIFGYNPDIPSPVYDPEQAKALLQEVHVKEWRVALDTRQLFKEAALLVRDQLAKVGVQVDVVVLADHEFYEKMRQRNSCFFLSRLGCPTGDASTALGIAAHSPDPSRNLGGYNWGGYKNPAVDRAIEESDEILQIEHRRHTLEQILATVTNDVMWIPLYFDQDTYVMDHEYSWEPRSDSYIFAAEIRKQE